MAYPTTDGPGAVDATLTRVNLVDTVFADDFNYPDDQIRTIQSWLGWGSGHGGLVGNTGTIGEGAGGIASPIADGGVAVKLAANRDFTSGTLLSVGDNDDVAYSEKLSVDFEGKMIAAGLTLGSTQPVVGVLDEDNMASDSDANLSTQQSIKAYVDASAFADPMTTQGDIIRRGAAVTERLALGGAGAVLTSVGGHAAWAANIGFADPMTTRGDLIYSAAGPVTARLGVGGAGEVLTSDGTDFSWAASAAGVTDHGALTGLADDDHSGHPWLIGRAGGQTLIGGISSGDDLQLQSTSHGTKGVVFLPSGESLIVGATAYVGTEIFRVAGAALVDQTIRATTFDTNIAAAGLTLAGTTLAADGSDAHIDITITPKGSAGIVLPNAAGPPGTTTSKLYQTGGVLYFDGVNLEGGGVSDHGALTGLADDDHSGHPWLIGRAGGQSLIGGTAANDDLQLSSTSNGTKGVVFVPSGDGLIVGATAYAGAEIFRVAGAVLVDQTIKATTFDTNIAAAGLTLAGTTLAADGSDTHIDITITPKGSAGIVLPNAAGAPGTTTSKLYQTGGVLYFDGVNLESVGSGLPVYSDVTAIRLASGSDNDIAYMVSEDSFYRYEASYGTFADDGRHVLVTGDGGNTRWIATGSGRSRKNFNGQSVGLGRYTLETMTDAAVYNIAIGSGALSDATDASAYNVAIGGLALGNAVGTGMDRNSGVGYSTLKLCTGAKNQAFGSYSQSNVLGGAQNVSMGDSSLLNVATGDNNVAVGHAAGYSALGDGNVFIGYNAGYNEAGSNTLYVANTNITTPLLRGTFPNTLLQVNTADMRVVATTSEPVLTIFRNENTVDTDYCGTLDFSGQDNGGNETIYGQVRTQIDDETGATEDGTVKISAMTNGTLTLCAEFYGNDIYTPGSIDVSADVNAVNADLSGYVSAVDCKLTGVVEIDSTQVLKEQQGGWTAPTAGTDKALSNYTGSSPSSNYVQAEAVSVDDQVKELNEVLRSLITDLMSHGLIGA